MYLFCGDDGACLLPTACLMSQAYESYKSNDGFLYITYNAESTLLIFILLLMHNNEQIFSRILGTMLFLYVILATGSPIPIGLALMAVIVLGGKISGGHYNPAVSMMAVGGKMRMADLAPYVLAQIAGGVAALNYTKELDFKYF